MDKLDKNVKADVFPTVGYKAMDYVFEAHSGMKVLRNLWSLPAAYFSGTSDLLVTTLAEDSFRNPWTRGNWNTKWRFDGNAVDDLRGNTPADWLERFYVREDVEVICSSNPNSPGLPNQEELQHVHNTSLSEVQCDESFTVLTNDLVGDWKCRDLHLPEDIVVVDPIPHFRRHLPSLKTLLSRLKTLYVLDPLLSRTSDTEELTLRHCEAYIPSPSVDYQTSPKLEEFSKEPLNDFEKLVLPGVINNLQLALESGTQFLEVCAPLKSASEQQEEHPPVLELLHSVEPPEIFERAPPELCNEESWTDQYMDTEVQGRMFLPNDLELDVTLTPTAARTHLSTSNLLTEHVSPLSQPYLLSARAKQGKERGVWNSEKHLKFALHFLFAEPDVNIETFEFHPLSEALKLNLEREIINESQTVAHLCPSVESIEKLDSLCQSAETELMEEIFLQVLLHSEDYSSSLLSESSHMVKCRTRTAPSTRQESFTHEPLSPASAPICQESSLVDTGTSSQHKTVVLQTRPVQPSTSSSLKMKRIQKLSGPLSNFMMLRSEHESPETKICSGLTPTSTLVRKMEHSALQSTEPKQHVEEVPSFQNSVLTGYAGRESTAADLPLAHPSVGQEKPSSHVVQVQASDSQLRAYLELLTFVQPQLSATKEFGMNHPACSDFRRLSPDQTRYLLKQVELALCHNQDLSPDQLLLFNSVQVIHTLVTVKELLLQCDLSTALDYLVQAAEKCPQQNLELLIKKLKIIRHICHKESNHKLQQLQHLIATSNTANTQTSDKILIIVSVDCDDSMSTIIQRLSQCTAVMSARPEENQTKLFGASLVSSMSDSKCVLVYGQHIGPDFPWDAFSLVVEFNSLGLSPWTSICRDRSVSHLRLSTSLPDDVETSFWCLEEEVPYVLIVTDGLVNCPLLLQSLESRFNLTVLERSACQSLQMSGDSQYFSVITVDEATTIIVQELDKLHHDRASEHVVMRLSALSLQYSYCWIILYQSNSPEGGFSSEVFSNLLLLYSSLLLFSLNPEHLNVKVVIVGEVLDVARWICRICFLSMMSNDHDPIGFLDRAWLTVTPSKDEQSLCQFPCVTSLVAQLMLKRAPSLPWLLEASLPQMRKLLPEVPEKVLKIFCDTTSLYRAPVWPEQGLTCTESPEPTSLHCSFWIPNIESQGSELFDRTTFLDGPEDGPVFSTQQKSHVGLFDSSSSSDSNGVFCQSILDLWKEQNRMEDGWNRKSQAADDLIQTLCAGDPICALDLTPAPQPPHWGHRGKNTRQERDTDYSYKCWIGEERKRSGDVSSLPDTGLSPVKHPRWSYEQVPGRSDGQTRLRLY
ncbi:protein shortage in chiasmata 1 ortholog [Synchiropus picturatus]